jgi:hypothetical protein
MVKEIVERNQQGISKKLRDYSPEGHLLREKTITVFGDHLKDCYKYLRKIEND